MKILSIRFKNINSLEGENQINFDQPPFVDSGVFAITGPNGSGKTSILDAITLGLYGETFKFDRPSSHVMTKHTAECFSEVVFSLGEEQFRSSWYVNREDSNPEGVVAKPKMQLTQLNGTEELLEDQPARVRETITRLTGMDFRNFTRSIMLAQGDFAAFLNALDNERLDILETMIGTDLYAEFKTEIENKAGLAKQRLEEIQSDLKQIQLLEPEKLEACELDLSDFKEQHDEHREKQNELKQQQAWLKNLKELEKRIELLQKDKQTADLEAEQRRTDLKTVAESQDVLEFKPDFDRIEEKENDIKQLRRDRDACRGEVIQLQTRLKELGAKESDRTPEDGKSVEEQREHFENVQLQFSQVKLDKQSEAGLLQALESQIFEKQSVLDTVSRWLKEHESESFLLNDIPDITRYKNLKTELQLIQTKQKSLVKQSKAAAATRDKDQSGITKANKKIVKLKRELNRKEIDLEELVQGKTLEDIVEVRKEQQQRNLQFTELLNLAVVHKKLDTKPGGMSSFFGKRELDKDELKAELASFIEQLEKEKNIQKTLEESAAREILIKKYEQERENLVEGKPCPLCGSLQHPYVKNLPQVADSAQAFEDQHSKIQTLQIKIERAREQIKVSQKQEKVDEKKEAHLVKIRSQWLTLCNRLNIIREGLHIDNIRMIKRMLGKEESELKTIVAIENKYRGLKVEMEKIRFQIKSNEESIQQFKSEIEKLDQEWKDQPQELKEIEKDEAHCQQQLKELTDKLVDQLTRLDEKLPTKSKQQEALRERLNLRQQEYQSYHIRQRDLQDEIEKIKEKISECRTKCTELDQSIKQYSVELKTGEVAGLHLALVENQKLIADIEKRAAAEEKELNSLRQALQEKAASTEYQTVSKLKEILTLVLSQSRLEQELGELESTIDGLTNELARENAERDSELAMELTKSGLDEIENNLREISGKMEIAAQEIARLENTVKQQESLQIQFAELSEELEKQQKAHDECEAELYQIKSDGASFRRKVQGIMADKLLSRANEYLEKISGRYHLHQKQSEQGLSLEIEDTFQKNCRRLPKTLSGGESFVVSLSLALALSEMANNGQSVDSLFLDEGFGNLDEEALYLVVTTLKSLQHHGKMVGVISHVKGVKDRIDTQIEMNRQPNGISSFAVVP